MQNENSNHLICGLIQFVKIRLRFENCHYFSGNSVQTEFSDDGRLTISGVCIYSIFHHNTSIVAVTLSGSFAFIPAYCFYGCTSLSSISIPNGITSIGESCFSGCPNLHSISLPSSLINIGDNAFSSSGIAEINLQEGMTYLSWNLFGICYSLTQIRIPSTVTSLMPRAFWRCKYLESITFSSSLTILDYGAFEGCEALTSVDLSELHSLKKIGNTCFQYCTKLESVIFPDELEEIGLKVFDVCQSLQNIKLSSSLKSIASEIKESVTIEYSSDSKILVECFKGWSSLKEIQIGKLIFDNREIIISDSIEIINPNAFNNCRNLKTIIFPATIKSIGKGAFDGCIPNTLEFKSYGFLDNDPLFLLDFNPEIDISFPRGQGIIGPFQYKNSEETIISVADDITKIYPFGFSGCEATKIIWNSKITEIPVGCFSYCRSLEEIDLRNVAHIKHYAFYSCYSLARVLNCNNVLTIGSYAFSSCKLEQITLSDDLTTIGERCFSSSSNLQTISIPDKVEIIPEYSFEQCWSLTTINLPKNLKIIDTCAFYRCGMNSIVLPDSVVEIRTGAFQSTQLESIKLPKSLQILGEYAFYQSELLSKVEFPKNTNLKILSMNAFEYCSVSLKTIEIPDSCQCFYSTIDGLETIIVGKNVTISRIETDNADPKYEIVYKGDEENDYNIRGGLGIFVLTYCKSAKVMPTYKINTFFTLPVELYRNRSNITIVYKGDLSSYSMFFNALTSYAFR